jgi:hypothetical protein
VGFVQVMSENVDEAIRPTPASQKATANALSSPNDARSPPNDARSPPNDARAFDAAAFRLGVDARPRAFGPTGARARLAHKDLETHDLQAGKQTRAATVGLFRGPTKRPDARPL